MESDGLYIRHVMDPVFGVPKVWRVDMPCEAELGGGNFFVFGGQQKGGRSKIINSGCFS